MSANGYRLHFAPAAGLCRDAVYISNPPDDGRTFVGHVERMLPADGWMALDTKGADVGAFRTRSEAAVFLAERAK